MRIMQISTSRERLAQLLHLPEEVKIAAVGSECQQGCVAITIAVPDDHPVFSDDSEYYAVMDDDGNWVRVPRKGACRGATSTDP